MSETATVLELCPEPELKSEIRWVMDGKIYGKPTLDDVQNYIKEYDHENG